MDANQSIPENSHKPGGGPAYRLPTTQAEAIQAFVVNLSGLYEKDYGDFMRRVGLYLDRLFVSLSGAPRAEEIAHQIRAIRQYLNFEPNLDIESTRTRIMRDVQALTKFI